MKIIEVVKGDYGYDFNFTLLDYEGNDFSLVNNTSVTFKAQHEDSAVADVSGAMTVESETGGEVSYTVADGDFDTIGDWYAEIEVVFSGAVRTFTDVLIRCKPELPR